MKRKKLLAGLTAAVMLCGAGMSLGVSSSMLVSADYKETSEDIFTLGYRTEYIDNLAGVIVFHSSITCRHFLVVTNGTALSEAHVQDLENYSSLTVVEWGEMEQFIYPEISAEQGDQVYQVSFTTVENMQNTARKFQLMNDFVESIHFVREHIYSGVELGSGLKLTPIDDSVELTLEDFPELKNLNIDDITVDGITLEGNGFWYGTFTDEIMEECHKTNVKGSYGAYLFMKEIADRVLLEHSDVLIAVEPSMDSRNFSSSVGYETQSIWQTAGDPNSDGTVDAQDAASLLETAAQIGTGARIAVTSAADVNADGTVGADDAAAVLTYAAAAGSGNPMSWVEVLRK